MPDERKGIVLLREVGSLVIRESGTEGRVRAVRVPYDAPTTVAPGDQVILDGIGGQTRVKAVRRG